MDENITKWLQAQASFGHRPSIMLLEHGRFFKAAALPTQYEQGVAKQCFGNAGRLVAIQHAPITYVEGLALKPGLFPMEHAWCVDDEGRVIDPTWDAPDACIYFGIPIKESYLSAFIQNSGRWGLFDDRQFWKDFEVNPGDIMANVSP